MSLVLDKIAYAYRETGGGIRNVSFTAPLGEWTGLVGRSGSGKSTLLRVIAGLLPPQAGTLTVSSKPIALVLQFPEHHFFSTTVRDELAFALKGQSLSRSQIDAQISSALSAVGIDANRMADASPFQLSSSRQRLVAIAAALIQKPQFLLLDEPGAGLDPKQRVAMFEYLDQWRCKTGSGIILSSHNADEVARWAANVVALSHGEVVFSGNLEQNPTFSWAREHKLGVPVSVAFLSALQELGHRVPSLARTPEQAAKLALQYLAHSIKEED